MRGHLRIIGLFAAALLLLSGCAKQAEKPLARTVFAMDTVMNLSVYGGSENDLDAAEKEIRRLDGALARAREGSEVYMLNQEGRVQSADVCRLAALTEQIADATEGAFDVTVAPVLQLWGFGENTELRRVPSASAIEEALGHVGHQSLRVEDGGTAAVLSLPAQVDFGGVAKGYTAAALCKALENTRGAVLDLGGDVALYGAKPDGSPWRVAVKDPADESGFLGTWESEGGVFVMTSGVYERYFESNGVRYHHIIDPRTGYPAQSGLVSVTVVCADGVWADALATAVCVLGAEKGLALRRQLAGTLPFELILVTKDGCVQYTSERFTPQAGSGYAYEKLA